MPRGKTAAQMVNIRSRRGPFSDPRDGRLLRGIRYAASAKERRGPNDQSVTGMDLCGPSHPGRQEQELAPGND